MQKVRLSGLDQSLWPEASAHWDKLLFRKNIFKSYNAFGCGIKTLNAGVYLFMICAKSNLLPTYLRTPSGTTLWNSLRISFWIVNCGLNGGLGSLTQFVVL